MALVTMRTLLDAAAAGGYALAAFNVNDMEQLQAVMLAASETRSPVIVQATRSARVFAGDAFLRSLVGTAADEYPEIPVAFHHDHGRSPASCFSAIAAGFTSVMMDGSLHEDGTTPSGFEYNVAVTRSVVERAHATGVTVEGELGRIGGVEDGQGSGRGLLTDPGQAVEFVERTGVDALAVAVGTSHGAAKFDHRPGQGALALEVLATVHSLLPQQHLVMHGSSSVPADLIADINRFGGRITRTWGVPVEQLQTAIQLGVRKINVDTDLRLAMTAAIRRELWQNPDLVDPRVYMEAARAAMTRVAAQHMVAFGQAGHAQDIGSSSTRGAARPAAAVSRS